MVFTCYKLIDHQGELDKDQAELDSACKHLKTCVEIMTALKSDVLSTGSYRIY